VLSKETPQPSTLQEQLLYIEFAYLFANLHRRRMETTILPIVVLLGIPGSGKGTLGKKIALNLTSTTSPSVTGQEIYARHLSQASQHALMI
jgi:signal recognition particle GTPase